MVEGEDKIKNLYKALVSDPDKEVSDKIKKYGIKSFKEKLMSDENAAGELAGYALKKKIVKDDTEYYTLIGSLQPKDVPAKAQPAQPPPISQAPPQQQARPVGVLAPPSLTERTAQQAVQPMPEQPVFQPFVQFKNEAELQQSAKSPVFKNNAAAEAVLLDRFQTYMGTPLAVEDDKNGRFRVEEWDDNAKLVKVLGTYDTKEEAHNYIRSTAKSAAPSGLIMPFKDAEADFAKMSPEQQKEAIQGSTGSALAESKKPKPTLLQQGKQAISDIASSFNRSVFKAPSAIAKTVSELGTGAYNLMGGDAKVEQDYLYQIADKYDKWIDDSEFAKEFIGDKNVNSLAGDVGSGLGQIATMVAAGGGSVAQGLKSAPSLLRGVAEKFITPASGVAFSQVFSSEYDNMKAKGESDNTALKQALANAFVSAPLESIPLINLTERMNAINPSLARKVINTLAQGFDEMTQERLQQAFSNITNNQLAQLESSIVKWSEGLDRSGEAGGLTGLIVGAIGQARIKRTKTPAAAGPSGQPPTQLGGIPTIPAPPNAPEFTPEAPVAPVPPPSGAEQTTYVTVTPEELQAFQQGQIDPERAAAIADDVALIQSGQMDINAIDDANYRLMVESALGAGQQQQQQATQNVSLENKVKETENKIKNKDLFLAQVDENGNRVVDEQTGRQSQSVGELISQSNDAPVPTSVREINGIEFVEFSNPRTGDVDVIVTGKNDGSYVGYYRLYDNGKPTNQWSSKFENPSRNKEDFKTMISGVQSMLPEGHEYTEKTSISTDGLRVWNQQLNRGYEMQYDGNGNLVTNKVAINGDAIVNELGIDVDKGSFENISVRNNADIKKVKQALLPYLQKLGLSEKNIYFENGTVYIDLPVLKKKQSNEGQTLADQAQQNLAPEANQPVEAAGTSTETGESGRPVVEGEDVSAEVVEEEGVKPSPTLTDVESTILGEDARKAMSKEIESQVLAKENELIEKQKQDIKKAKNDLGAINNGDKAVIDEYVKKSGYKLVTKEVIANNPKSELLKKSKGKYYNSTGASIQVKTAEQIAIDGAGKKANSKPTGSKVGANKYVDAYNAITKLSKGEITAAEAKSIFEKAGLKAPKAVEESLKEQPAPAQTPAQQIAALRAKEQAEYDAMPDPNDVAKREEIYGRYDKLIREAQGEKAAPVVKEKAAPSTKEEGKPKPESKPKADPFATFDTKGEEKALAEKEFYKKYTAQHKDIRAQSLEEKQATKNKILAEGFKEQGRNVNALPIYRGPDGTITDKQYGNKKGDFVYLLPKEGVVNTRNGYVNKAGYIPSKFDVVEIEYDGQPTYEAYSNQFKKADNPFLVFETAGEEGRKARAKLKESVGNDMFNQIQKAHKNAEKILRGMPEVFKIDCP